MSKVPNASVNSTHMLPNKHTIYSDRTWQLSTTCHCQGLTAVYYTSAGLITQSRNSIELGISGRLATCRALFQRTRIQYS